MRWRGERGGRGLIYVFSSKRYQSPLLRERRQERGCGGGSDHVDIRICHIVQNKNSANILLLLSLPFYPKSTKKKRSRINPIQPKPQVLTHHTLMLQSTQISSSRTSILVFFFSFFFFQFFFSNLMTFIARPC